MGACDSDSEGKCRVYKYMFSPHEIVESDACGSYAGEGKCKHDRRPCSVLEETVS